ncbi:MAG: ABC transporter permease, partial [Bacteroidales bacterium]|nr:ABC transporter permease [Bacteroidales bacterium]
ESIIYFKSSIHHANWNESECHSCGNVNPEQVFNIVEAKVLDEYGQATNVRKVSPEEWAGFYLHHIAGTGKKLPEGKGIPEITFKTPNRLKQFIVFTRRDLLSKLADRQYLLITLLEAPVLAFFLSFLIRYYDESTRNAGYTLLENDNLPVYLFMSVIVALFMGLTVSAEEIIKDRKILKREAFLNLSWNSYLMSKVVVQLGISAIQAFTFVLIGNQITEIRGMMFEYWLLLFSVWAAANLLGLVISDSFKAVVTIYILIPFLVIPQIILSGIIVKFEKLNPNISSPSEIPFYGEMIVARWGYEALAVKQFRDNEFEKQFYHFEKRMSIANFKKNYWYTTMRTKLDNLERDLAENSFDDRSLSDLELLSNEINREMLIIPALKFDYAELLTPETLNRDIIEASRQYLETVNRIYIREYNRANNEKDELITAATEEDAEAFHRMKQMHYNNSLEEFVRNSNESKRSIEYRGRIIQKIDPVFLDPEHRFIKAHFYAPRKQFGGLFFDTFWVNITIIWLMTLLTYLILYFRLLKRILDFAGSMGVKKSGNDSD